MYGGSGEEASERMRQEQKIQEQKILAAQNAINAAFGNFNPAFYNQRKQEYLNYQMPLLTEQYLRTQKDLAYKLAQQGLLNSSAGGQLRGSLVTENERQRLALADAAAQQSNQLRQGIEQNRSSLLSQAQSMIDPSQAYNQAIASAQQFNAPSTIAPVGQMFTDWANIMLPQRTNQAYNWANQKGYFSPGKSSYEVK